VPKLSPPQPPEIVDRFHEALADGMKNGGLSPMSVAAVRKGLKLPPHGGGCSGGPCVAAAVAALGHTRRYATASVDVQGKNYQITVQMFSGRNATAKATGRCDICTLSEAVRVMTKVTGEAASKALAAPPPKPAPKPKAAPKPEVPPEKKPAAAGEKVTPKPLPEVPPPPPPSRRSWPLWPALASLGLGVAGLAAGIPLLALDGEPTNCIGEPRPDARNCADLYSTAGGGWALTGVGITALTASGVFFYLHFSRGGTERSTQVSLRPLDGGMVLSASGSF
jgi:hypothetical protein